MATGSGGRRGGRFFRSGAGGQRAVEGHSTSSQLFTSRPAPRPERPLFAAEGRKNDLLPYEVTENNRSQQVVCINKQPLNPCSVRWLLS
jgi:hypothetical protein